MINDSKVTIVYIGFFGLPDKEAAAHRVLNNARLLRKLDFNVVFVDEQEDCLEDNILKTKKRVDGFEVYSQKRPSNNKAYLKKMTCDSEVEKVINKLENVKMIIAYNYPSISLNKIRKKYQPHIKVCSDITEWYSGQEYSFPLNILGYLDSVYRMRIVNPKLDGLICISSFLYDFYRTKSICVKIPPLINIKEDIWNQDILTFDHKKINLVYGGSPGREKDKIRPIIEGVYKTKNRERIVLRIVGITKEQYLDINPDDCNIIRELGDSIEFIGRVSHECNVRIVKSSDYLVFIRNRTRVTMAGFSTKFVEAVTCNTSVITTDTGELKKYIKKIGKGIVLKDNQEIATIFDALEVQACNKLPELNSMFDYRNYKIEMKRWCQTMGILKSEEEEYEIE